MKPLRISQIPSSGLHLGKFRTRLWHAVLQMKIAVPQKKYTEYVFPNIWPWQLPNSNGNKCSPKPGKTTSTIFQGFAPALKGVISTMYYIFYLQKRTAPGGHPTPILIIRLRHNLKPLL